MQCVGEPLRWTAATGEEVSGPEARKAYMRALDKRMRELAAEGQFAPWD